MVYSVVLAAGIGKRMKGKIPKQFLNINNLPIFEYSIIKFLKIKNINKIFLVINEKYKDNIYNKNFIKK